MAKRKEQEGDLTGALDSLVRESGTKPFTLRGEYGQREGELLREISQAAEGIDLTIQGVIGRWVMTFGPATRDHLLRVAKKRKEPASTTPDA